MATDEQHIALPHLYGAPAYARPPHPVATAERPFDPDELPIEAFQTNEERDFQSSLPARAYAPGGITLGRKAPQEAGRDGDLRPRAFSLKRITGRLFGES